MSLIADLGSTLFKVVAGVFPPVGRTVNAGRFLHVPREIDCLSEGLPINND